MEIHELSYEGRLSGGLSADSTANSGVHFYRQPGGCIELHQADDDVVHICGVEDARTVIKELTEFVNKAEKTPIFGETNVE